MKARGHCGLFATDTATSRGLKILIADLKPERAAIIAAGLAGFGDVEIHSADSLNALQAGTDRSRCDVVIISCDKPDGRVFEYVSEANAQAPRPTILFVEASDPSLTERAMQAGVAAYVVGGLEEGRIKPIVELATSRFAHVQRLQAELQKARADLAARKTIERAKGILMERNRLSEADAYNTLRRSAMEEGRTLADVASAVLSVTRLLKV